MNPHRLLLGILVVEDCDEDFDTAEEAVQVVGARVDVRRAASGDACIAMLRDPAHELPAVILMDLNTPGIDGREALTLIKNDPQLRTVPVVIMSTSANASDLQYCYRAGANAYHVKPVRYAEHLQLRVDLIGYWTERVTLLGAPREGLVAQ